MVKKNLYMFIILYEYLYIYKKYDLILIKYIYILNIYVYLIVKSLLLIYISLKNFFFIYTIYIHTK